MACWLYALSALVAGLAYLASEGRASDDLPTLPPVLEAGQDTGLPPLPPSLNETPAHTKSPGEQRAGIELPLDLTGFWETRFGLHTQRDHYERDASIGETRLQLELEHVGDLATLKLTTDFLYDPVLDHHDVWLEDGRGWIDLREASAVFSPTSFADVKIGRQILTWGTGDLVFINDLFPKDWNAFLIGRDVEYLKAPSDAVKVGLFSELANLNIVYTPRFDADRFIDGRRVSYWNSALGRRAGRDAVVQTLRPDDWLNDDELAVRVYRNVRGYELAAYAYHGFWKSPGGSDAATGKAIFPDLSVYGASARGPLLRGIANIEYGFFVSRNDRRGDDPMVRNSENRFLAGYEQEIGRDFTLGLQYYLEHMKDHDTYKRSLSPGMPVADRNRHVLTVRLTKLLMSQNLELSFFAFYSPSDRDAYLRPRAHYKIDDHWSVELGGNVFVGNDPHTFFGQFEDNTNVYAGVRYGF